ncbi:MAG: hypothetical protein DLM58_19675 [Pseudonocardiales bacterium]|nr:MAG: hypothetical protein DLM58_19675 [Pseudonocardiales bacterium]
MVTLAGVIAARNLLGQPVDDVATEILQPACNCPYCWRMPGRADDCVRAAHEHLLGLGLDAEQLAALRKSMTDIRVAIQVDVLAMSALTAYEFAKAEAYRLWAWAELAEALFDANEPEEIEGGALRAGVLVGVTELAPAEAVRSACAVFADRQWSEPAPRAIPQHQFAVWKADLRPSRGLLRIELHAAPGLSPITERRRQELLDDQDFAYLHDLLRQG